MPSRSNKDDYFSNIRSAQARVAAINGYIYKELILKSPQPSLAKVPLTILSRLPAGKLKTHLIKLMTWLAAKKMHATNTASPKFPDGYVVMHEDLFFLPRGWRRNKLSNGHYVLSRKSSIIGLIACRRGAIDSAILGDCLSRAGVQRVVFIGTCLSLVGEQSLPLVASEYSGDNEFIERVFGRGTPTPDLYQKIMRSMSDGGLTPKLGRVFQAHGFLAQEAPDTLSLLCQEGDVAVEMEGVGLASALVNRGCQFSAALIPLDSFSSSTGMEKHLNSDVAIYTRLIEYVPKVFDCVVDAMLSSGTNGS